MVSSIKKVQYTIVQVHSDMAVSLYR